MTDACAISAGRMERVSPQPVKPPAVSLFNIAYSPCETGSRAMYALQFVIDRRSEPKRGVPDCAASIGASRALRRSTARMLFHSTTEQRAAGQLTSRQLRDKLTS